MRYAYCHCPAVMSTRRTGNTNLVSVRIDLANVVVSVIRHQLRQELIVDVRKTLDDRCLENLIPAFKLDNLDVIVAHALALGYSLMWTRHHYYCEKP